MYWQNFRRYWKQQLTHAAVGAVAGFLLVSGHPWAGMGVLALVIARQALEYAKRKDTPGIDLAYHLAGCILGIAGGIGCT